MTNEDPVTLADERPPVLTVGLVMLSIKAALGLVIFPLLMTLLAIGLAIALEELHRDDEIIPVMIVGSLCGLLFLAAFLFQLVLLAACWFAWRLSRTGLWVCLTLSVLLALFGGVFGKLSGIVTIIGCVMALERKYPGATT